MEWASDSTPPDGTTTDMSCGNAIPDGSGPQALYSGCGSNLDRSLVRSVSVPAGGGQLSFDTLYDTEEGWDFGFVQVSTDGGKTWTVARHGGHDVRRTTPTRGRRGGEPARADG